MTDLPPPQRPRPNNNGKWVVIALVAAGTIGGIAASKYRKIPGQRDRTTRPTTMPTDNR
jgi:hypothetical protein